MLPSRKYDVSLLFEMQDLLIFYTKNVLVFIDLSFIRSKMFLSEFSVLFLNDGSSHFRSDD